MSEIYRQGFKKLSRDNRTSHRYVILMDGIFYEEIWADNDEDAIEQFREMEVA